ncbi:MAG: hypothetical protein K2X93_21990 [Candidatus Obscuribacterales bacterium]|nr:hypothetical protein [Candidatus Obscuribacterales bacterium]
MAGVKYGIWKRGNNWYISVKVNGRRRAKSFGRDRKAAELALAEILKHRAVANATNDWSGLAEFTKPKTRKTFSEVAENYLDERASLNHSTLRGYREVLRNYLLPAFGEMEVSDITEEDVARFQANVSKNVSAVRTNNVMGYDVQTEGAAAIHQEYWIPAERLNEFNANIVGPIEVIDRFDRAT